MGDIAYGFLSAYGMVGKYSKLALILLMLFGFIGGLANAQISATCNPKPLTAPACGAATAPAAASKCTTTPCSVETSAACPSPLTQCVTQQEAVAIPICSIYLTVHNIIFILGLVLVILGGALYAGSHVMPGQSKGAVQGYGMGFILGGVIGVIIAIIAPFIIGVISNQPGATIASNCNTI